MIIGVNDYRSWPKLRYAVNDANAIEEKLVSHFGFQRDHILLVDLDPSRSGYNGNRLLGGYKELLARLEAIPGVRSATLCGVPGFNFSVGLPRMTPL